MINVDKFTNNKKWPLFNFSVNFTDVDAKDADRKKLYSSKKHDDCRQRCPTLYRNFRVQNFADNQIDSQYKCNGSDDEAKQT